MAKAFLLRRRRKKNHRTKNRDRSKCRRQGWSQPRFLELKGCDLGTRILILPQELECVTVFSSKLKRWSRARCQQATAAAAARRFSMSSSPSPFVMPRRDEDALSFPWRNEIWIIHRFHGELQEMSAQAVGNESAGPEAADHGIGESSSPSSPSQTELADAADSLSEIPQSCTMSTLDIPITSSLSIKILEDLEEEADGQDVEEHVGRFLWPTARPMMKILQEQLLLHSPHETEHTIVVELGAGCGLLGMGLALMNNFYKVIITDHDVEWLDRNLALNRHLLTGDDGDRTKNVSTMRLDWGNSSEIGTLCSILEKTTQSLKEFNLLLVASDILYNHQSHRALATAVHRLSSVSSPNTNTRIMIGFLNDRDNDEAKFLPIAREVFGNEFPASKSIFVDRSQSRLKGSHTRPPTKMEVHLIDYTVT